MIRVTLVVAKQLFHWLPQSERNKVDEAFFNDSKHVMLNLSQSEYDEVLAKAQHYDYLQKLLPKCVENNNKGLKFEKLGQFKDAIRTYEKNIGIDKYPATHAYDRLLVIYHRQKDYKNEKRIAEIAISVFPTITKYKERLLKIEQSISKEQRL